MQKEQLKLYGGIWSWGQNSAENFIYRLNELDKQRPDVIDLHVHCMGGEVLEGIAIYNAIKACKTPVDCYVDGVAASMATIVILACRKVYMADNAFLMIHAPSGMAQGTAKDLMRVAKALKGMEANFKRDYLNKTGKTEAEVSVWFDGDNWFSAEEALREKLIDGVVTAVDGGVRLPAPEELKINTATMMYQRYTALCTASNNNSPNPQKTKINMNKEELIVRFGLTSVTAESPEADIYAAIEAKVKASDQAKATAEAALLTEKTKQVKTIVASQKEELKLTAEQVTQFESIGVNAGIEALQTALSFAKPRPTFTGMINNGQGGIKQSDVEVKTFSELVALGEDTLATWKKDRPEDYQRLYKAEFGHNPEIK